MKLGRPRSFDHDQAVEMVRSGRSLASVAAELGVSREAVSEAVRSWETVTGIDLGIAPGRRPRVPVERILALAAEGKSKAAIGREVGLTRSAVSLTVLRAGKSEQPPPMKITPMLEMLKQGFTEEDMRAEFGPVRGPPELRGTWPRTAEEQPLPAETENAG